MPKVMIIDDFLPDDLWKEYQNLISTDDFPWYLSHGIVYAGDDTVSDELPNKHNTMFGNVIFNKYGFTSQDSYRMVPIIEYIMNAFDGKFLAKAKLNMTPRAEKPYVTGYHQDLQFANDLESWRTGVLYDSKNDGFTLFADGKIIESKPNRFLLFKGNEYHTGTLSTDVARRVVFNINFMI